MRQQTDQVRSSAIASRVPLRPTSEVSDRAAPAAAVTHRAATQLTAQRPEVCRKGVYLGPRLIDHLIIVERQRRLNVDCRWRRIQHASQIRVRCRRLSACDRRLRASIRPRDQERRPRRRDRSSGPPRRRRGQGRPHRRGRRGIRSRAADDRRHRPRRGAGIHRRAGAVGRHAPRGRQRREPHPPGHHDGNHRRRQHAGAVDPRHGRPGGSRQISPAVRLDRIRRLPAHVAESRDVDQPRVVRAGRGDPRAGPRHAEPYAHAGGTAARAGDPRPRDAAGRLRFRDRSDLSARLLHAHRGARRARPRRVEVRRRLHLTRARRELSREGRHRRSDRHRTAGGTAGRHLSPEDRRECELGPHGRDPRRDRGGP